MKVAIAAISLLFSVAANAAAVSALCSHTATKSFDLKMNLIITWFPVQQVPDAEDISARAVDDMSLEVSVSYPSFLGIRSGYMDCSVFSPITEEILLYRNGMFRWH